jgi:FKBP12-rapamycin complex-associated protein
LFLYVQCIDKARDILDTELTAMVGESYNRAYGVSKCI